MEKKNHVSIMVKFKKAEDPANRKNEMSELLGESIVEARSLFPDSEDEELATMFELLVLEESDTGSIVKTLQGQSAIEYAHEPVDRKLK